MRFVTVNLGCDWTDCPTVAPEGENIVVERTINGRRFNICKTHDEALDEILLPLLKAGIKEGPTPKKRSVPAVAPVDTVHHTVDVKCRVPGCPSSAKGNVGLAQHLKKKHDMTIAQHDQLPEVT